jgi:hypothetical protein
VTVTSKQEFLAELPIFYNLDAQAIEDLARITVEYEFDEGAVIAYQRDVANSLFIVKEGRLFARALDNNGIARETRAYTPGQYFGETWLFAPSVHSATVKGSESGRLLVIDGPAFLHLLEANHRIVTQLAPAMDEEGNPLGLSAEGWEEARKLLVRSSRRGPDVGLMPEELLEYFSRRSVWFLLMRLLLPLVLVLVAPVVYVLLPEGIGLVRIFRWAAPMLILGFGLFLIAWRWLDWRNDYFAITSNNLMHREFDLRHIRIDLIKVPISQIQSVSIDKPSFIANLFNIGDARITTAAVTGLVVFDNIDKPEKVRETLNRLTSRVRSMDTAQEQAAMRRSIEQHFELDPFLRSVDGPAIPRNAVPKPEGFWAAFVTRFGSRVEVGNVITYRKSFVILLKYIAAPLLGFVALFVGTYVMVQLGVSNSINALVTGIGFLVILGWFIWQLENWRNDIFQLTDRFVIDIDRLPFGFSESKKQAALSNIQNVAAERPGFFPTLFNYGRVVIDTAGAKGDIVFEDVPNPGLIQGDIFRRLDEYRQQQRIREGSDRRREYAVLLDVYRQAMEEERIPRRMPESESE